MPVNIASLGFGVSRKGLLELLRRAAVSTAVLLLCAAVGFGLTLTLFRYSLFFAHRAQDFRIVTGERFLIEFGCDLSEMTIEDTNTLAEAAVERSVYFRGRLLGVVPSSMRRESISFPNSPTSLLDLEHSLGYSFAGYRLDECIFLVGLEKIWP